MAPDNVQWSPCSITDRKAPIIATVPQETKVNSSKYFSSDRQNTGIIAQPSNDNLREIFKINLQNAFKNESMTNRRNIHVHTPIASGVVPTSISLMRQKTLFLTFQFLIVYKF